MAAPVTPTANPISPPSPLPTSTPPEVAPITKALEVIESLREENIALRERIAQLEAEKAALSRSLDQAKASPFEQLLPKKVSTPVEEDWELVVQDVAPEEVALALEQIAEFKNQLEILAIDHGFKNLKDFLNSPDGQPPKEASLPVRACQGVVASGSALVAFGKSAADQVSTLKSITEAGISGYKFLSDPRVLALLYLVL